MTYTPDIFGQIISANELETAVIDTLNSWFKTYARELEIQLDLPQDALPMPRSFITVDKIDRGNKDQLPSIVVVSPGLAGKAPKQEGDGTFTANFSVGVGIFVSGRDDVSTKNLVRWYASIVRAIMLQKQSLGGFTSGGVTWLDESYDDNFQVTDNLTVGAGELVFDISVVGVVNRVGGPPYPIPPDPDTQPGSQWPTANTVEAEVEMMED